MGHTNLTDISTQRLRMTRKDTSSPSPSSSSPTTSPEVVLSNSSTTAIPVSVPPARVHPSHLQLPPHHPQHSHHHQQQQHHLQRPRWQNNYHPPPPLTRSGLNGLSRFNMKAKSMAQLPTSSEAAASSSLPSSPVTSSIPNCIVKEQKKKLQRQLSATAFVRRGSASSGNRVFPSSFNSSPPPVIHPLHPSQRINLPPNHPLHLQGKSPSPTTTTTDGDSTLNCQSTIDRTKPPKPPATVDQLKVCIQVFARPLNIVNKGLK